MDFVDLLAFCRVKGVSWYFVAREAQRPGGIERLRSLVSSEATSDARRSLELLKGAKHLLAENRAVVEEMVSSARADGIRTKSISQEFEPDRTALR